MTSADRVPCLHTASRSWTARCRTARVGLWGGEHPGVGILVRLAATVDWARERDESGDALTYRIALRLANIIWKIMFCSANLSIHHAIGVLATGRRTARTSRVLQVSVVPWLCKVRVLWEEEHEVRDIVKHIIKLKVTCTLKSALHSCRLSTQCQSGPGSPQVLTKKRKYIQRWR